MEEQNNSGAAPQQEQPKVQVPAQPPAQAPARTATRFWLKAVAALYLLSLVAAFSLIAKAEAARKTRTKDVDLSKITDIGKAKKKAVGLIEIYGPISQGSSARSWDRGSQQISRKIRAMAADKDVKAVVLDINSPGGSVGAVQEIYAAVLRAKAESKKPFVARFGEVSASGGYYVGAACDRVVAHPGSITGSIGVIFSVPNFEGLMKKVGFRNEAIKSGKFKDIGSPVREMTPEERRLLQAMIDDSYAQFVAAVAEGRKMPEDKVRLLADGRIYTGRQAAEAGLVDTLGDLQEALDAAGELAGIGKDPRVIRESAPLEQLFSLMDSRLSFGTREVAAALGAVPSLEYRWYGR
ncbi:MAG: signal peptide peptidase SppA [Elusimicrobiales bacterium]|nr:signal peptide peptidase SppA [Elusimicrobiales bacterium]